MAILVDRALLTIQSYSFIKVVGMKLVSEKFSFLRTVFSRANASQNRDFVMFVI